MLIHIGSDSVDTDIKVLGSGPGPTKKGDNLHFNMEINFTGQMNSKKYIFIQNLILRFFWILDVYETP